MCLCCKTSPFGTNLCTTEAKLFSQVVNHNHINSYKLASLVLLLLFFLIIWVSQVPEIYRKMHLVLLYKNQLHKCHEVVHYDVTIWQERLLVAMYISCCGSFSNWIHNQFKNHFLSILVDDVLPYLVLRCFEDNIYHETAFTVSESQGSNCLML